MSCNICQSKFSLFTREVGCPSCGFSCCSKCLKYKLELPKVGVKKVCGRCYNKSKTRKMSTEDNTETSTSKVANENLLPPIDIVNKVESLENPSKPPIVMYKQDVTHLDKMKAGMEQADLEIIERLQKLKGEDKQARPPSIDEINRRLALLKDKDPESMETSPVDIHQVDSRTSQQKVDDLLKQYMESLTVENSSVAGLQARLDQLKGLEMSKMSKSGFDGDEDETSVTKRIIKKALEEAAIEAKFGCVDEVEELEESPRSNYDDDEEPMCDECGDTDGLSYCKGCGNKLYCSLCFEDNHDEDEVDMRKHVREFLKKSKKSAED